MSLDSIHHPQGEHADIIVGRWHKPCCEHEGRSPSSSSVLGWASSCLTCFVQLCFPLPDGNKTTVSCPVSAKARGLASSTGHSRVTHWWMRAPVPSLTAAAIPLSLLRSDSGRGGRRAEGCWRGSPAGTHLEGHSRGSLSRGQCSAASQRDMGMEQPRLRSLLASANTMVPDGSAHGQGLFRRWWLWWQGPDVRIEKCLPPSLEEQPGEKSLSPLLSSVSSHGHGSAVGRAAAGGMQQPMVQDIAQFPAQDSSVNTYPCLWVPVCGARPFSAMAQLFWLL